MHRIFQLIAISLLAFNLSAAQAEMNSEQISLEEAGRYAVMGNLSLAADSISAAAAHSLRVLASLPLNPELEAGFSQDRPSKDSRWSISISQPLGLSRLSRVHAARGNESAEAAGLTKSMLDTYRSGIEAGLAVWIAQEELRRFSSAVEVASVVESLTAKRCEAGLDAEPMLIHARSDCAMAIAEMENAAARLVEEHGRCRNLWGSFSAEAFSIFLPKDFDTTLPTLDSLMASADNGIAAAYSAQSLFRDKEILAAEKLLSVPDIRVSGGLEGIPGGEIAGLTAGLAFELPIFSRNTSGRTQAGAMAKSSELRYAERRQQNRTAVETLHSQLAASLKKVSLHRDIILPGASAYREAIRSSYEAGRFDYRDIAEADRNFLEADAALSAAIAECYSIRADIDYLCTRTSAANPHRKQ